MDIQLNRRKLLKGALVGLPLVSLFRLKPAFGADKPMCKESDAAAKNLGYCENLKKVSATNCANMNTEEKKKHSCATCNYYVKIGGKGDKEYGDCKILPGCTVHAIGGCNLWAKKA